METAAMDSRTFRGICDLIYEKSGIRITEKKEALVLNRMGKRMRALGMEKHRDYLEMVRRDDNVEELNNLLDVVSTNVTHFFRESKHFEFLGQTATQWMSSGRRKLRFWCAASSSGEEPYSIAFTLCEASAGFDCDIRILATDICRRVLEQGKAGVYPKKKVGDVPAKMRSTYFTARTQGGETEYEVRPEVKRMVRFARLNLSEPPFPMAGPFDMIFIRNVMIYFDNEMRSRVLREAYRLLAPGGFLIVGHAESLAGLLNSDFKKVHTSIYTR